MMALFLLWHCKNKQAQTTKQSLRSGTQDDRQDIQMGQNTAYTREQNGQERFEMRGNGAYRNRPQDSQRHLELSDNTEYEQRDETGQSDEPYYSRIPDNGTQDN